MQPGVRPVNPTVALFISFEGIDGCGKTTQLERLRARLIDCGFDVVATREPGGTALAETIRHAILHSAHPLAPPSELLLFGAARAQHVAEIIRPAMERGAVVLSDRFSDSGVAYQGGGLGIDAGFIRRMNDFATQGLQPNLTFVLDVPPEIGLQRRRRQQGIDSSAHGDRTDDDRIEQRGLEFQSRVRAAFLELAETEPQRIVVVDAAASADLIHERIYAELQRRDVAP